MAALKAKLGTARLPRILRDIMEQILPVAKAVEDDPRTDIGGDDQVDHAMGQLVRIVPAPIGESLEPGREFSSAS